MYIGVWVWECTRAERGDLRVRRRKEGDLRDVEEVVNGFVVVDVVQVDEVVVAGEVVVPLSM